MLWAHRSTPWHAVRSGTRPWHVYGSHGSPGGLHEDEPPGGRQLRRSAPIPRRATGCRTSGSLRVHGPPAGHRAGTMGTAITTDGTAHRAESPAGAATDERRTTGHG